MSRGKTHKSFSHVLIKLVGMLNLPTGDSVSTFRVSNYTFFSSVFSPCSSRGTVIFFCGIYCHFFVVALTLSTEGFMNNLFVKYSRRLR